MRYLLSLLFVLFLSAPALANSGFCPMNGPHNCTVQNEDQLVAITQNTIHQLQLTQDPHPFKTRNDEVMAQAQRNTTSHAQLQQNDNRDYTLFRR